MTGTGGYQRRWWALGLASLAQFLIILDTSIIGIALPDIQTALGFSESALQWVFNAYVIAFGGLLLLGGRLADLLGPRRVFTIGFVTLTGASLLAGLAWSSEALVAGRALQGVGAALIAPAALAIVMNLFTTPAELGKAMAIWGAAAPAGGTAGVFLGGVITEWISWRWTFLVNVPVGLLVLLTLPALVPAISGRRGRLDIAGAVSVTAALSVAVYAIVTANDNGWGSLETLGLLSVAAALLVGFVAIESRRAEPLVRLGIFRSHNLAASNAVMALLGAAWIPMWFYLNLYLQQILGLSAFGSGAALLPMTVAIMVLMIGVTGRVVARFGFKPPMVSGLVLLALAIALLARVPVDGGFVRDVLGASLVAAAGMSLAYIPALVASLASAKPEEAGLASGLVNTSYQVGSALGLAAMTAVAVAVGEGASVTDGYRAAFIGAAAVAALAAVIAAVAVRRPQPPLEEVDPEPLGADGLGRGDSVATPIVIGYDGSEGARGAIEYAGRYFAGHRAVVVTAFEEWPPAVQGEPVVVDESTRAKTVETAEEGAALARRVGIDAEARVVISAEKPWKSIIRVADELAADLIVVGSHGFNGVRPLVLGSVSHQLGHHAHQAIVAVPTPEAVAARQRQKANAEKQELVQH